MIVPYWQSSDGSITVYNERFEAVLEAGLVPVEEVALVHDDPHYGVNERTERASNNRGARTARVGSSDRKPRQTVWLGVRFAARLHLAEAA